MRLKTAAAIAASAAILAGGILLGRVVQESATELERGRARKPLENPLGITNHVIVKNDGLVVFDFTGDIMFLDSSKYGVYEFAYNVDGVQRRARFMGPSISVEIYDAD